MRSHRGLTLLEAMMSLFFVMLLLGLFASLAHKFDAVLKHSASKANTLTTLQVGLRHLADDVRQAVPGTLTASPVELRLARPAQDLGAWLPATPPTVPWVPSTSYLRVRYYLAQGTLFREAGTTTHGLSEGLSAFSVQLRGSVVEVQMAQEETKRTVVLKGVASVARF